MSKERELLQYILNSHAANGSKLDKFWKEKIEEMLAQPEQDKVDFETLNEMGLKRLQVSDTLVLQESCSKSPTLIFAENGNVLEIVKYNKLLEIKSFIDEILNYADTPK